MILNAYKLWENVLIKVVVLANFILFSYFRVYRYNTFLFLISKIIIIIIKYLLLIHPTVGPNFATRFWKWLVYWKPNIQKYIVEIINRVEFWSARS